MTYSSEGERLLPRLFIYLQRQQLIEMNALDVNQLDSINDITPTDARILNHLRQGRNVPVNIADEIDRHSKHVSNRLSSLRDKGLVRPVGNESVSLHEITDKGERVHESYVKFQQELES
jgi:DNA-binding MarR family transcriptional regulator